MDINERVLAAFQAEHKEQLEGIRAMLAALDGDQGVDVPSCIDEAFRLAHSLKGGARVCDLRPAETLAHKLESVFEQIRSGHLRIDSMAVTTINVVLDAIEDWMAALDRDEHPGDSYEALDSVERLLRHDVRHAPIATGDETDRLFQAFLSEYPQYLTGLRRFAAALDVSGDSPSEEIDEAFRLAHNLRGSARAAGISSIAGELKELEKLITGFRDQTTVADTASSRQLIEHCDIIDFELTSLRGSGDTVSSSAVGMPDAAPAAMTVKVGELASQPTVQASRHGTSKVANMRAPDTVRISTQSLDKLLQSSRQLASESLHQQRLTTALDDVRQLVSEMQRERESIRRVAAGCVHRLNTVPEFHRLAAYLETVDRNVQSLARQTRSLCEVQKRNAWQLRSRSRQIQQDVQQARLVPAEVVYQGLRKLVRDLAKEEGKQVSFHVSGFDVLADRMVFQALKDPLIHMLRNCVVHGIEVPAERLHAGKSEASHIDLRIEARGNQIIIEVNDDGRGIDRERIANRALEEGLITQGDAAALTDEQVGNLVFQPGFSTSDDLSEIAGRGMGLSVVREAVERLQGKVQICQKDSAGARFRITIPLCVSSHRLLLVSASEQTYAIPLRSIVRLLRIKTTEIHSIEDKPVISFQGRPIALVSLTNLLELPNATLKVNGDELCVAVLKAGARRLAVSLDALVAERELLIQDLDGAVASSQYLGAVLLEDSSVALVLNPTELLARMRPAKEKFTVEEAKTPSEKIKTRVLVVDDSFTTRTLEKSILEANGFHVGIAVDGVEGLNRLRSEQYDLVISDIEMPRMDGFALLREIKRDHRLASIPVILVTSRGHRVDQEKGLDLGAEAYIVKQKFDHQSLLNTIRQVVNTEHGVESDQDSRHDH